MSFIFYPGLTNVLSGHCESWATIKKPLSRQLHKCFRYLPIKKSPKKVFFCEVFNSRLTINCAKRTPEGSYSTVAQGSQCPVRALVNPGNILNGICTPERGTSRHIKLKYPFQGYMFSAITPRVNNALSGHCEPWATAEKPLSGVCFAQSRA